jgi:hypothetical protein
MYKESDGFQSFSELNCALANAESDRLIDRQTVGQPKRGVRRIVSAYYEALLCVYVGLGVVVYKIKSIEPVHYIHYTDSLHRYKDIYIAVDYNGILGGYKNETLR